jgi:signal peptidase I
MKNHNERFTLLPFLMAISTGTMLISNIIAGKQFQLFGLALPCAVMIFPITYILSDVFSEVYGFKWSRRSAWLAFGMNLFAVAAFQMTISLPGVPWFTAQAAFETVLGNTPRILAASLTSYMVGDLVFMTKLSDEDKLALKENDIITYRAPIDIDGDGKIGDVNTHRVVSHDVATGVIVTKGDNNLLKDNEGDDSYTIHRNDVIGKCTEKGKLGGVGNVITFLRSSLGFFLCIVLPLILFFLYELYNFITVIVSERAKKAPVAKETEEEIKRRAIEEYIKSQQAAAAAQQSAEEKTEAAQESPAEQESSSDEEK